MSWKVTIKDSVIDDLRWFGRKQGRKVLKEAEKKLSQNPHEESRNMKTLRPNRVAQRELRLFGKYRILFNVDDETSTVTIVLAGEKRGDILLVQGEEFEGHHESDSVE
ncbi:MAG TPA: hypothetical protein VGZ47_12135 [Gemmataceae bacterium]|jgi:mRNA-degrading endonuclease RelE of RelBE toxin-antitoxin system|nr:hypothetical protein [Gemmataceae bacterium]